MTEQVCALDAQVKLFGLVDDAMYKSFADQLNEAKNGDASSILVSLTTTGGDAETGRRMAEDIRLCGQQGGKTMRFLGIAAVYSAGITIMAAFEPQHRFLSRGTELLIHERRIDKTVQLSGALRTNVGMLRDEMAALESGQRLEREGFAQLVKGTAMTIDQLMEKVMNTDWYVPAAEAMRLGLVRDVI